MREFTARRKRRPSSSTTPRKPSRDRFTARGEQAIVVEHDAARVARPGWEGDGVIGIVLGEFSAIADEEKVAIVGLAADPGIDQEAAGNGVVGGVIVAKLDGIRCRRSRDGVRHMHGKGLVLRAEAAQHRLQLRGGSEGGELAGEDIRGNRCQRDEEHHRREGHEQVGDNKAIAHLPQHVVDEPPVEDDATEDQPDRDNNREGQAC